MFHLHTFLFQNRDVDDSAKVHGPPKLILTNQGKKINSGFIILHDIFLKQMDLFGEKNYASNGVLCIQFSIPQAIPNTCVPSHSSGERNGC
jgi:hypothetical protein